MDVKYGIGQLHVAVGTGMTAWRDPAGIAARTRYAPARALLPGVRRHRRQAGSDVSQDMAGVIRIAGGRLLASERSETRR